MRPAGESSISRAGILFLTLLIILPTPAATNGQSISPPAPRQNQGATRTENRKAKASEAPANGNSVDPSSRPVEIENLIVEVNAAPPEVAADALVRVAASKNVSSPAWKKEILEKAFYLTSGAGEPVRRKYNPSINASADTSANYLSYAFDRKLDTLSLRIRIIKAMLAVDKQRARELFEGISPKLPLPPLTCDDALVYDVSDYYGLLDDLAEHAFSEEESRQGAPARFIRTYIDAISSPAQIAPAIKVILSIKTSRDDFAFLVQGLIKTLGSLPADDRSFTYAVTNDDLTGSIYHLGQSLEKRGVYLVKDLVAAYRNYLRENMGGSRCAENAVTGESKLPRYIQQANYELFQDSPLKFEEVKQRDISGRANIYEYWKTPDAERLLDQYKDLRFTPVYGSPVENDSRKENASEGVIRGQATSKVEKESVEWQSKFRQFLTSLEGWSGSNEKSNLDYFNQKQVLYRGLLEIAPRGKVREEVLKSWVKSLGEEEAEGSGIILSCLYVNYLLEATRNSAPETRDKILELMIYSNSPALSVYGKLAKLQV
jgi:hypothetical protein